MKIVIMVVFLFIAVHLYGASPFTLSFTTVDYGSNPNILAVYITQGATYIDTIGVYGADNGLLLDLSNWKAASGISKYTSVAPDAYMGATRSTFTSPNPVVVTWDLNDKNGVAVPDGTYTVNLDIANENQGEKFTSFSFVKDSTAGTRTVANTAYFTGISITYAPPASGNTAPVALAQSVTNAEDTAKLITLTATDAESNTLTYAIASNPAHGTLSAITATNQVTYTPATNYYGADSFTFTASDASLTSTPATVSITVTPVNDAPVAQAQSLTATDGNVLPIILSATDAETNALTYNLVSLPVHGYLLGAPPSLTYVPVRGLSGSDSFTFNAFDGMATGNTAAVSITLVFIDSSSNGIPDSWQSAYGITDAAADPDGDGASNYAEYMAGTDPTNKTSVFSVNVPQITGGSNVVLRWSSVQYRFYSVLTTTNLVSGWSTLASNNLATPPQNVYTGTYNQAGSVFYRVQLDP